MLNGIKTAIEFVYGILIYFWYIAMDFIPSPFKEIAIVFYTVIIIIFLIKIVNFIGNLVQDIVGVFK